MSRRARWVATAVLVVLVVAVDQVTKAVIRASLAPGERVGLVPGVHLVRVRNEGIAFGALGGAGSAVVIAVGVAVVGIALFFVLNARRPLVWLPTGLLLGGALGNVIDRVRLGGVTDFLKLPHWPAFNVADTAITLGVLSLLVVLDAARGR